MKILVSRFGSHFGYSFRRRRLRITVLIHTIWILLLLLWILSLVRGQLLPIAVSLAEAKSKALGVAIINEAVTQQITQNNAEFLQLYDIQKNTDGEITAITANVARMNTLKAELTRVIQKRLSEIDTKEIGIPVGNLFNQEFLSGRGPKIPMKIVTVGTTAIDFSNTFTAAGINQTKYEVLLDVKLNVSAILPTQTASVEVSSSLPVAQTIIVGKVPDAYANIGVVN